MPWSASTAVDDRIETANHFHRIGLIIGEGLKAFYCRRLAVWDRKRGYLRDTRLAAPGAFKVWLDYCRDLCQNK